MGFIEAVSVCFRKYVVFSGRARRSEYWWFVLAGFLLSLAAGMLDAIVAPAADAGPVSVIVSLALLLPSLAAAARRMHDTDRSGWWILIAVVPLIGWIVFIVFAAQDGTSGPNRFGSDPKGRAAAAAA